VAKKHGHPVVPVNKHVHKYIPRESYWIT